MGCFRITDNAGLGRWFSRFNLNYLFLYVSRVMPQILEDDAECLNKVPAVSPQAQIVMFLRGRRRSRRYEKECFFAVSYDHSRKQALAQNGVSALKIESLPRHFPQNYLHSVQASAGHFCEEPELNLGLQWVI